MRRIRSFALIHDVFYLALMLLPNGHVFQQLAVFWMIFTNFVKGVRYLLAAVFTQKVKSMKFIVSKFFGKIGIFTTTWDLVHQVQQRFPKVGVTCNALENTECLFF